MLNPAEPQNVFAVRFFWLKIDALIVIISYFLGSIPFGLIISRMKGIDIRQHGSGNIGATNVTRVLGKGPGYTVFALDAIKGLASVFIGEYLARNHSISFTQVNETLATTGGHIVSHSTFFERLPESIGAISAAIACIIGHNFPIWLRFKGGKGMATSAGVLIGMLPLTAVTCLIIWAIVFLTTRYVSLASIAASIALPVSTMVYLILLPHRGDNWPYFYFAVAACLLAVWRHRSNIVRLANGTENKFEKKSKEPTPA